MHTVTFKFRQSVAALLREPKTEEQRASYVFPDRLWTEAIQNEWAKREYITLVLCKQEASPWQYGFKSEFNDAAVSNNAIKDHPNFAYLRISRIEVLDKPEFEDEELFELKTSFTDFVNSVRFMIPTPVPALPKPVDTPPSLSISGRFDEETETELGNLFSQIKFAEVCTMPFKTAFDPILMSQLQHNQISDNFHLGHNSVYASSTMDILRRHFRETKIFSRLEMKNNPLFSFADFEAIFQTLLEMPFSWDQVGDEECPDDEYVFLQAHFEEDATKKLCDFRPDLVDETDGDCYEPDDCEHWNRWTKNEEEGLCIQVQVFENTNYWMFMFVRVGEFEEF
ncbi:hypothetical protein L596_016673 [Steinernema carpocapsae]|uniref:Uncharacterized protein n=1 Tax=Steinernema carpocapsae TaxID=34508 RepID=A0A4U5NJF1_STECR|nr:hypothetical protein L596_016673 [Steinernema carpocapsae]